MRKRSKKYFNVIFGKKKYLKFQCPYLQIEYYKNLIYLLFGLFFGWIFLSDFIRSAGFIAACMPCKEIAKYSRQASKKKRCQKKTEKVICSITKVTCSDVFKTKRYIFPAAPLKWHLFRHPSGHFLHDLGEFL